ncbi:MAG: glycosyltransferase [Prevotellaceae bacterium]|nr:glycosyltransferase [Candidatus Colivivens equi]
MEINNKNSVTVITAVWNDAEHIEKTIQSVLSQTYQNIEYIIIDGGSKDRTVDVIKEYADKISYWTSEPDKGVYDAMNKGIAASTGDFVIFMNSGDTFHSVDAIEKMFLDNVDKNTIVYGNVSVKYWDGVVVEKPHEFFKTSMKFKGVGICHQTVLFPGEVIRKMKYDLSYRIASDYDLMYRMWKNSVSFVYRDVVVADYEWGNGISSNPYKLLDVYRENARVCGQQRNPFYWAKLALEYYRLKKKQK